MKIYYYLLAAACSAATIGMTSCAEDLPGPSPASEQYTYAFIKQFGLIDPKQDWNKATEARVSVNVGEHARSLKVYVRAGSQYYLCADLIDLSGNVTIPVDIPEGSTDLMVKVDGEEYFTKVGATLDLSHMSRAASTGSTTVTGAGGQSITVTVGTPAGTKEYFKFNAQQMGPILAPSTSLNYDGSSAIPGTNANDPYYWADYYSITPGYEGLQTNPRTAPGGRVPEEESNLTRAAVHQDVRITLKNNSCIIYPMYWYTHRVHTLSLYFINDDDTPLLDSEGNILMVPFYQSKGENDIQWYKKAAAGPPESAGDMRLRAAYDAALTSLSGWPFYQTDEESGQYVQDGGNYVVDDTKLSTFLAALQEYYNGGGTFTVMTESWGTATLPDYNSYEITRVEEAQDCGPNNMQLYITFSPKATEGEAEAGNDSYPDGYPEALKETGGSWVSWKENNVAYGVESWPSDGCYAFREEALMRSKGISIDITGWNGRYGIYTDFEYNHAYSQSSLNEIQSESGSNSFAAFYFHPVTNALFYSFEDWVGTQKADLNDMVFMIENVDHMDTNNGRIPVGVKTTTTNDQILSWIVAAEDLGATDDFDFNDVVFQISSVTTNYSEVENLYGDLEQTQLVGSNKKTEIHKEVRIQALAAGGTQPVWLHYYDGTTDYILGPDNKVVMNDGTTDCTDCEWHRWFGHQDASSMINTGTRFTTSKPAACVLGYVNSQSVNDGTPTVTELWRIEAFKNFSIANYCKHLTANKVEGFYITVNTSAAGSQMTDIADGRLISAPNPGDAPQMFLIPDLGADDGNWKWPTERTQIYTAYEGFVDWVNDAEGASEWHKHPKSDTLVTRPTAF